MKRIILAIFIVLCFIAHAQAGMVVQSVASGGGTVAYGSASTVTDQTAEDFTITAPSSTSSGNGLYAFIFDDTDQAITLSGWTVVNSTTNSSSRHTLLFKEAGGSEPGSYVFDAAASSSKSGAIIRITKTGGVWDTSFDEDVDWSSAIVDGNATLATDNVTCVDGSFLLAAWGSDDLTSVDTAPTDMTEVVENTGASHVQAVYYESRDAGVISRTLEWLTGSIQQTALAVVARLQ